MEKFTGLLLIVSFFGLAASYRYTGHGKFIDVIRNCKTLTGCPGLLELNPTCGSDGKTYMTAASISCMNNCLPEGEKVTVRKEGFCEDEYQKEFMEGLDRRQKLMEEVKNNIKELLTEKKVAASKRVATKP